MFVPGYRPHADLHVRHPSKTDRWLVGLVAGAALLVVLGKALDLGRNPRRPSRPQRSQA